jgi:zinc/manganese transport system ATP-binding protein
MMTLVRTEQAAADPSDAAATHSVVSVRHARMAFGDRILWDALDLEIEPGEFIAVLGPNGSGKTTLLQVLLGLRRLSAGEVLVDGRPPGRGSDRIGYIPQQGTVDAELPLRGRDLVGLGLDGHRLGPGPLSLRARRDRRRQVDAALAEVGATGYADAAVARLSGGEQQRLRVAQALVGDPSVLLCDEPLLSLDLASQRTVAMLIEIRRRTAGTPVVFVTHEINPVLPLVDRVLYLVDGRFRVGPVEEVMTSEVLSELYGTEVDVLRVRDRLVVVGAEEAPHHVHSDDNEP